LVGINETKSL